MEPKTRGVKIPPFYGAFSPKACFSVMLSTAVLGIPIMVLISWFCHIVGVIPICYAVQSP